MERQSRLRAGLPDGVLSGAGSTGQSVKETAVSSIERIPVSREVLVTMHAAVKLCRDTLSGPLPADAYEHGVQLAQLTTKLLDIQLSLESLCRPQS